MADPYFGNFVVMVVEDNEFIRLMLKKYLSEYGFREVIEAVNGMDGIRQLGRNPDLIVCDINMEPINGFEFVKHVRALEGPAGQVPIIFLTGNATAKDVQGALDLSVNAYLLKPVTSKALKNKIISLMVRKKEGTGDGAPGPDAE